MCRITLWISRLSFPTLVQRGRGVTQDSDLTPGDLRAVVENHKQVGVMDVWGVDPCGRMKAGASNTVFIRSFITYVERFSSPSEALFPFPSIYPLPSQVFRTHGVLLPPDDPLDQLWMAIGSALEGRKKGDIAKVAPLSSTFPEFQLPVLL